MPSNLQLLDEFNNRPAGVTMIEFAVQKGMTLAALNGKLYRGRADKLLKVSIPESRYKVWDDWPKLEGDYLILCDTHIPYHDAEFIQHCIKRAIDAGIHRLILGGDVLEQNAFSHWPGDFQPNKSKIISAELEKELRDVADKADATTRASILDKLAGANRQPGDAGEEIKEARIVLKQIGESFDEIVYIMGNHESWTLRLLDRVLPSADIGVLFGLGPKWKLTPYYWCELTSGGKLWRVTHPKNSTKGSGKKLAPKYKANIIMAHGHHFAIMSAPDGELISIEPGACNDRRRIAHENQRDTSGDMHTLGAVMIKDGKAILLNQWFE